MMRQLIGNAHHRSNGFHPGNTDNFGQVYARPRGQITMEDIQIPDAVPDVRHVVLRLNPTVTYFNPLYTGGEHRFVEIADGNRYRERVVLGDRRSLPGDSQESVNRQIWIVNTRDDGRITLQNKQTRVYLAMVNSDEGLKLAGIAEVGEDENCLWEILTNY